MGQLADDMTNGFRCSNCGICFEDEHGYPVLCKSCKENDPESEIQEAHLKEL